ncbi:MAG: hypothetical protein ACTSPV_07065 [Candidatus Hodarchaeales archaeon]
MKAQNLAISTLSLFILFSLIAQPGLAREPTFGVAVGESYTYRLETARLNGSPTNYTIYGEWTDTFHRYVATEGETWTYTILNTTVEEYSWFGINVSLTFGNLTVSGDIFFWLLHDIWPWDQAIPLGLYDSLFQDLHSDNETYWESMVLDLKSKTNMSQYDIFDVTVTETTLNIHIIPKDKSWQEEQKFELNLEKGIVTSMEVKLNSSLEYITADHVKIICTTVPPLNNFGSSTPGFEIVSILLSLVFVTISTVIKKRK